MNIQTHSLACSGSQMATWKWQLDDKHPRVDSYEYSRAAGDPGAVVDDAFALSLTQAERHRSLLDDQVGAY